MFLRERERKEVFFVPFEMKIEKRTSARKRKLNVCLEKNRTVEFFFLKNGVAYKKIQILTQKHAFVVPFHV